MERFKSEALDTILGKQFKVLDDGFIRAVDYMGTDQSIVQAARVSYGDGTKKVNDDEGLIRYLVRNQHSSPIEMCELKLHVRVPMDCWRQWIRHRTASVNEVSTRYSIAIDSAQKTDYNKWRLQATENKQGSSGFIIDELDGRMLSADEVNLQEHARNVYKQRLDKGIAREQARKDLPLSTYTEAYWKCDLHNLLHFLRLRLDKHAQLEIRLYAQAIADVVKIWVPYTWSAFSDYILNTVKLTDREIKLIGSITDTTKAIALCESFGWFRNGKPLKNREFSEFKDKAKLLNIILPW
jgi:thymidylate synthase (FAD)